MSAGLITGFKKKIRLALQGAYLIINIVAGVNPYSSGVFSVALATLISLPSTASTYSS